MASLRPPSSLARRLIAVAALLGSAVATAAAQHEEDPQGAEWGLGVGVISQQEAYRAIRRETKAVPVLRFENEYVEFFGLGLEVKLPGLQLGERRRIDFALVAEADLSGYEAEDAPILAGMTRRKDGLWAGARAEWEEGFVDVSVEWAADASGRSKGRRLSLGLEKDWHMGERVMLTAYLAAHRLDSRYVAGRAAYVGRGGVNVDIGLRTLYRFDEHHSVLLDAGVTRLAKPIRNSPLVDRSSTNQLLLGYLYDFR
jgi:MipA family protein